MENRKMRLITPKDVYKNLPSVEELALYLPEGKEGSIQAYSGYYRPGPDKSLLPCGKWITSSGSKDFEEAEQYYNYSGQVDNNFKPHGTGILYCIKNGREKTVSGYFYHGIPGFSNVVTNKSGIFDYIDLF